MTPDRDHQRSRVYAWEDRLIAPRDPSQVPFSAAQGMVNAIWSEMGLRYPPAVDPLPPQTRTRMADASRLALRLPPVTPSWVLLHELAHAMTSTHDGRSDGHGPAFVGLYVQLLARYLRLETGWLLQTLEEAGIRIEPQARPVFVEA
jgi:hypothetical protein